MTDIAKAGVYPIAGRSVKRMGYGAMQLAGPGVFGPPKDRDQCIAVLREAIESGVDHIDTSDFYGPHVVNEIIKEALHPYPKGLVLVSKVGAVRGPDASWNPAQSPAELVKGVHDNLQRLGVETIDVVNLRITGAVHHPTEGSIAERFGALVELKRQGKVRGIGLSNVTAAQVAEAREIDEVACVQNLYNLVHRGDDPLVDALATAGIPYVPFFPLGGFSPIQSQVLSDIATELDKTPMQLALAWLLHRAPNILLIPGTSSLGHLRENLAAAEIVLKPETLARLDAIGAKVTA